MMETLYVAKDAKLERQDSTLVVRAAGTKTRITVVGLKSVVLAGEEGMTTSVLALLARHDVRVTVLDWNGNVAGSFEPLGQPSSGLVRLAQARHALDPSLRIVLARRIVRGALANLRANLRYRAYRGVQGLEAHLSAISRFDEQAATATSLEQLMGYEGNARAWYYQAWPLIHEGLAFGARRRRPPNNPVNCLISWYNSLAYSLVRNEIAKTHLDDCVSFLHASHESRHSLALDLSELFKPALVDGLIFETVIRSGLTAGWFQESDGVCRLTEDGRKATLDAWVARTERQEAGKPSYRDLVRAEALAIERHVLGIAEYVAWERRV